VTVSIRIDSLHGERTGQETSPEAFFNVNAKLEEQKKASNQVELAFNLLIETKPNTVKYAVTGIIKLEGSLHDISKRLEANPKTNIPQILFTVYQHVFNSIYVLSSVLNTPYPPPDLLHPMQEKIQILRENDENETTQSKQETKPIDSEAEKATETPEKAPRQQNVSVVQPEAVEAAQ
jgi:hypothetical protein